MRNGLTPNRGAHIVIEYPSELPNVISEGISVSPGAESMISLKMSEISRLTPPYGNCTDTILDPDIQSMYPQNYKYSAKSCNSFCVIVNTMRECNCMIDESVGGILLNDYDKLKISRPTCPKNSSCSGDPKKWFQPCKCYPECDDTTYQVAPYCAIIPMYYDYLYFI